MTDFYINKHIFSNTLYYRPESSTTDKVKDDLPKEGVKSYGKYNLIGRYKVARGQAFENTFLIKNEKGEEKTIVQIIAAKDLAKYKARELTKGKTIKASAVIKDLYDKALSQIKFWKNNSEPDHALENLDSMLNQKFDDLHSPHRLDTK